MKRLLYTFVLGLLLVAAGALSLWPQAQAAQVSSRRLVTVLASGQRTATTTSADITNGGENLNVKGGYITLDVTGVLTTPVITVSVQIKDPASSKYETILTATSGVTTTGTHTYLIYPGAGSAGADVTQVAGYVLPPTWRVQVAHTDTDPITYSVGAMLLE